MLQFQKSKGIKWSGQQWQCDQCHQCVCGASSHLMLHFTLTALLLGTHVAEQIAVLTGWGHSWGSGWVTESKEAFIEFGNILSFLAMEYSYALKIPHCSCREYWMLWFLLFCGSDVFWNLSLPLSPKFCEEMDQECVVGDRSRHSHLLLARGAVGKAEDIKWINQ